MDNMNKSLDEIIKTRPKSSHRRSSARQRIKAAAKGTAAQPAAAQQQSAEKIIVSGLPQDVNEAQVKELFTTTVGPLKEVTLHYDSNGRSKGTASVHFQRKGDGTKAFQQYNNRLIDGRRPMKIEIVYDPTRVAPGPSLASRVAPAAPVVQANGVRNGTRPGARRGRGGRGGRPRKNDRPAKSAADLDAEMEDYSATTTTAAPAA
ncbi:hypothetical protein BDP27DRAFT_30155 [Rhodocollybia butyracea]|uniref:RRM domain-containing protein n=1 Tax=Rhodocollybia butyracea TaxID=206335 RepID=A0A9P5QCG3_9AGAR|nr:hypothetical protein BDP27DRAFT_30155 [Rhodocollybia butyracea]